MKRKWLAGVMVLAACRVSAESIGWRYDGFGHFPRDAAPPLEFSDGWRYDQKTKEWREGAPKNFLWRVETKNWSCSSPIIFGDRVYVTSEPEPGDYAPVITCYALADGKELWTCRLDHVPGLPVSAEEQAKISADFKLVHQIRADAAFVQHAHGRVIGLRKDQPDHPWIKEYDGIVARYGWQVNKDDPKFSLIEKHANHMHAHPKGFDGRMREMREKYNCIQPDWADGLGARWGRFSLEIRGAWVGYSHPTPLWDGQRLIVLAGANTLFAVDMDGKLLWRTVMPCPQIANLWGTGQVMGAFQHSPVLIDGKIVTFTACVLRALSPAEGKVLWETPIPDSGVSCQWQNVAPMCFLFDGVPYALCTNSKIYRLTDGREVSDYLGGPPRASSRKDSGAPPPGASWGCMRPLIGFRDGVVYLNFNDYGGRISGGGKDADCHRAVRLKKLDDGRIGFDVLWTEPGVVDSGYSQAALLLADRITGNRTVDLAAGKDLKGWGVNNGPHGGIPHSLVGGRWIFTGDGHTGEKGLPIYIYDTQTGKRLPTQWIRPAPDTDEKLRKMWCSSSFWPSKGWSIPAFQGRHLVIRNYDYLYCFAAPQ